MQLLDLAGLEKLEAYLASGDLEFDFEHADETKRLFILEFLEKLMDVADLADQVATRVIFKDSALSELVGANTQK